MEPDLLNAVEYATCYTLDTLHIAEQFDFDCELKPDTALLVRLTTSLLTADDTGHQVVPPTPAAAKSEIHKALELLQQRGVLIKCADPLSGYRWEFTEHGRTVFQYTHDRIGFGLLSN